MIPVLSGSFVFLDGASGTMLQKFGLECGQRPDIMNITAPEAVESVQRMYLSAGSDIIYTNTFGANAIALRGSGYSPDEIITAAVAITKRACNGSAKTALDIGPLGEFISPVGDLTFENAYELFKEQAIAGESAGADMAVIETMSDLMELKAAILAVRENTRLPIFATMTFDKCGRTFSGCLPESFALMAQRLGVSALGLNCSLEPTQMFPVAERIAKMTTLPLIIKPNAGLPDSAGHYCTTPAEFARQMARYAEIGVRYIGGCCGTSPEYISELRRVFAELTPGVVTNRAGKFVCSPSHLELLDGFTPSRKHNDGFADFESELNRISCQADGGNNIIEAFIPDDSETASRLITAARELADKPMLIYSDSKTALNSALRLVCGVAAVTFPHGSTDSLVETAEKYGTVVL